MSQGIDEDSAPTILDIPEVRHPEPPSLFDVLGFQEVFGIAQKFMVTRDLAKLNEDVAGRKYRTPLGKVEDILNGVWSGFPACCIFDFYQGYYGFLMGAVRPEMYLITPRPGYVPCRNCITRGKVVTEVYQGYLSRRKNGVFVMEGVEDITAPRVPRDQTVPRAEKSRRR